ncbi:SDR family NAD(P)-dependent oxidoreductase [Paenibacillus polymyxa]|uniref:SDR family NAD(P)-dependent oxidoreductase n=1 Tax=Paenibacillus polymyxa TaxID=1406 RepID=UPI00069479DC|nr:SDR family NAD(P)-dependent oxidoreductase [Paenibacillus polymyxa]
MKTTDARLIHDIKTALHRLDYIQDTHITVDERPIGNRTLHARDWLPTANSVGRSEASTSIGRPKSEQIAPNDLLPWAIRHGEPVHKSTNSPACLLDMLTQAASNSKQYFVYLTENGTEMRTDYAELLSRAKRILHGLRKLGLQQQDKVIFQFQQNENFIPVFWACILGGYISVPVGVAASYDDTNADTLKLYNIWEMLDRPIIVTDVSLEQEIRKLELVWGVEGIEIASAESLHNYEEAIELHESNEQDFVLFLFTSGSTGMPKCVRHHNHSIVARTMATAQMHNFDQEEVLLNWMPLEHVGGLVMFHILGVYLGCRQVLPRVEAFMAKPLDWLSWMDTYQVTLTWAPNFAFSLINDLKEEMEQRSWDLSSVKHILNGGEAIVAKTAKQFLCLLHKHNLRTDCMFPSFGMSETSSGIVFSLVLREDETSGVHYVDKRSFHEVLKFTDSDDTESICFTGVGGPIPGVSVRIVDDTNTLVREQYIGRVQVAGPTIMAGYDQNPEANREVFTEDGWFNTGDLGFIKDGQLTITGRQKDIIVINGKNYYNYEIESIAGEVHGVLSTYVAAVPFVEPITRREELVVFFSPAELEDLKYVNFIIKQIRWTISKQLGLNPKYIIPLSKESFSKTESGKIQRNKFADRFNDGEFEGMIRGFEVLNEDIQTFPEWMYTRKWECAPPYNNDHQSPGNSPIGTFLVFMDSYGVGSAWAARFAHTCTLIQVDAGPEFVKKGPQHYTLNPRSAGDYDRLKEELSREALHIDQVIHLWSYQPSERIQSAAFTNELSAFQDAQYQGSFSLVNLCRIWNQEEDGAATWTVVSSGVHWFHRDDTIAYEHATIPGLIRTFKHELPHVQAKFVDMDPEFTVDEVLSILQSEIGNHDIPNVLYRDGKRLVPSLQKVKVDQQTLQPLPLVKQGLYLITGGLGGIGVHVARYLIQYYDAYVILLGRSALEEPDSAVSERQRALSELQELANREHQVRYMQTDVSSADQIQQILEEGMRLVGVKRLDGIIHLAGRYEEKILSEETPQSLKENYSGKVWGTYILARLLEQYPDALFVTTSSTSSLQSGYGIGAYTSANMFTEIFTEYLADRYSNVYCMSWSLWNHIGMGVQFAGIQDLLHKRGHLAISATKGIYSLELALMLRQPLLYIGLDQASSDIAFLTKETERRKVWITIDFSSSRGPSYSEVYDSLRDLFADTSSERYEILLRHTTQLSSVQFKRNDERESSGYIEKELLRILIPIVKNEEIKVYDSFFEMGGNSLDASRFLAAVHMHFGVTIPMKTFFQNPTVKGLAYHIASASKEVTESNNSVIPKDTDTQVQLPKFIGLTPSQLGQWVLYQSHKESPFYNNTFALHFKGELDTGRLLNSLERVVQNQDALRMRLTTGEEGGVKLWIQSAVAIAIPIMDLTEQTEVQQELHLKELIYVEANKPFLLEREALSRFSLIKLGSDHHILLGSMHHIISDGWSIHVLTEELMRYYENQPSHNLEAEDHAAYTYGHFLLEQHKWMSSGDPLLTEQIGYWKRALAEEFPTLNLPLNYSRPPIQTYQGQTIEYALEQELASSIKEACKQTQSTLYMFMLSVYASLLYRYTGQKQIRIGTVLANRNWPQSDEWIGYLANTLALSVDFTEATDFESLLAQVKTTALEAQENQNIPLELLLRELQIKPMPDRSPLFQTVFTVQNAHQSTYTMDKTKVDLHIEPSMTAKYEVSLHVYEEKEQLQLKLEYNTHLFDEQTMRALIGHYVSLTEAAAHHCCSTFQKTAQ